MAEAFLDADGQLWLRSEYRERDLVKAIPGRRYHREHQLWSVPLSWGTLYALRGIFGQQVDRYGHLHAWAADNWPWLQQRLSMREASDAEGYLGMPEGLSPFQRSGAVFLHLAEQALLADGMGAGKTIETIAALRLTAANPERPEPLPALIICPNSMKLTWQRELEKWWPGARVAVSGRTAGTRKKAIGAVSAGEADFLVMNWESFWRHSRLEAFGSAVKLTDKEKSPKELNSIAWRTIIADESHRAMNPRSKQARGLWAVGHQEGVYYRYGLTGTPVESTPDQLWSQLHFIAPKEWPSKTQYVERYCQQSYTPWGADVVGLLPANASEFYSILFPMYIRRPKEVVIEGLPDKLPPQIRYVEMEPKQAKAYRQMRDLFVAELEDGAVVHATSPLAVATRLGQLASAFGEVVDWEEVVNEAGEVFRKPVIKLKAPSNKVDALEEIIEEAGGEPLVVFAESRQLIALCEARLKKKKVDYGVIAGDRSPEERQQDMDDFQDGRLQVMLCTFGAGAEGITLTAASTVVMLQRAWSRIKNEQAEDRVHRRGQDREVQVINVISTDTIDEIRLAVFGEKTGKVEELLWDEDTRRKFLGL